MDYRVTETFYSIQGEGPSVGTPAFFIRLAGCSVGCEICDSKYSWAVPKETQTEDQILAPLQKTPAKLIVITGGEPLQQDLIPLLRAINDLPDIYKIEIETSCVVPPPDALMDTLNDLNGTYCFNCSPKLESARALQGELTLSNLEHFIPTNSIFKFVIEDLEDIEQVSDLIVEHGIDERDVYLMPKAITQEELLERSTWLIEQCKDRGYKFTPRLHIWLWGARRGV